jgi:multiple sugar transport system substrate-binding protein
MEFLSQPDVLAQQTYKTQGTLLPPLTSLLEGEEITQEKPILEGFIDLMPCGVASTVSNPKFPRVEVALNEELGKAMYGDQSAEDALNNAAQQAEAILAR